MARVRGRQSGAVSLVVLKVFVCVWNEDLSFLLVTGLGRRLKGLL